MHLEIQKGDLEYLLKIIRIFKLKCKAKSTLLTLIFEEDGTNLIYSSESFFLKFKHSYVAEFKGQYGVSIEFIKNIVVLFDDDIVEIDFRDNTVTAYQNNTTLKGSVMTGRDDFVNINEEELEEMPLEFTLSNKLLALDVEEMGFEDKDPYRQLYHISGDKLVKMSSFCALMQTLEKEAQCETTLTQDVLSICAIVRDTAQFYRYQNSFYICDKELEIKMPLANIKFPPLGKIIDNIKKGSESFMIKTVYLLDICEKCCNFSLEKKINRVNTLFKDGLIMYDYNGVLTGSVESGLTIDWKASFNPLLMRNILKYINEECVIICKNQGNNIIVHNIDNTIMFMLALCR